MRNGFDIETFGFFSSPFSFFLPSPLIGKYSNRHVVDGLIDNDA